MSNSLKYRVSIVGLTGIGAGSPMAEGPAGFGANMPHSHATSYSHVPETEVVGACDLVPERLEEFVRNWSATWPRLKGYRDFRQMLEEQKPDILSVVTSDNRHADIVVHAAEAGVRGIFCEKPIATCLADADRMIEAVKRRGCVMTINHSRRWYPIFHQVKAEVAKGAIGELKRITLNFGGPRAILFRNGTHMIDMICFLADSDPEWVFAELDPGYEDYWPYRGDGGRNADLEPGCSGYIHFRNGVRAFYNGSKGLTPRRGWELTGTQGWVLVDDQHAEVGTAAGTRLICSESRTAQGTPAAIRDLIRVMENGGRTVSPPEEARKTLEVILGFLASQKLGNVRINLPLDEAKV
ncbi:MAG: Gfo/Idh/MocA family oxidoreductase [Planctomycetes bacterium]|nr:Gfo/Idh/MocA family oxidoreductase [Planctomycetota bacterium]